MMKWFSWLVLGMAVCGVCADDFEPVPPPPPEAPVTDEADSKDVSEVRRRRYEIMVLLQAYRILPEEQKAAVREEILKRLREDYTANRERLTRTIERLEKELARLKAQAAKKEDAETAVHGEFERLLKLPIGGMGPEGWIHPPRRYGDSRPGPKGDRGENRGRFRGEPQPERDGASHADGGSVAGE